MASVTATTAVDTFNGGGGGGNTSRRNDTITFTSQSQLQANDTLDGGAGFDTLILGTSIDFTSAGTVGTNTGLRNLEALQFNGAFFAIFRSDQFGTGLLSDSLQLTGTGGQQNIIINMVAAAPVLDMRAWTFSSWTAGSEDLITVNGSTGDDRIVVSINHTIFDGGAGSDTIDYSPYGGNGFTLTLNGSNWVNADFTTVYDTLRNVENVIGTQGNDVVTGDWLNNSLWGEGGNDTLSGGAGNDVLDGGTGADQLTGGVGNDTFYVDNAGDVVIDRASDAGTDLVFSSVSFDASGTNQDGIENITLTGTAAINATGNGLDNILVGNSAANVLTGNGGNDTLDGGGGSDTLRGGLGNDTLTGGAGADIFVLDLNDTTAAQFDTITDFSIADGDRIDLGAMGPASFEALSRWLIRTDTSGNAFLAGAWDTNFQSLTLTGVAQENLTANEFIFDTSATPRVIVGTANVDMLFGGLGSDTLSGGEGIDFLVGDAGNDILNGGNGNDVLDGGLGADNMTGGSGNDTYFVDDAGDVVNEAPADGGRDRVYATTSFDMTGTAAGVENAFLFGTGNFNLTGNDLNNSLSGNSANNVLNGGNGNDVLRGNDGNDRLIGGAGNDSLYGGEGSDVFEFAVGSGPDTIFDFNTAEDQVDLRSYGVDTAAELAPFAADVGSNLVVNFGNGDIITIANLQWAHVTDALFVV